MTRGKHVMTEKPTGWNLEECRKLTWLTRRHPEVKVGVGYSLRYYPLYIHVKQALADGEIGEVNDVFSFNQPYGTFVLMRMKSGATIHATAAFAAESAQTSPQCLCVQGKNGTLVTQYEYQEGTPLIAPLLDSVRTSELLHAIWDSHNLEIRVPLHRPNRTG